MKIVIVGGGTAGWLAALFISKIQKSHNVTMIESSKIGIIGAGEGSTGILTDVINNFFCDFNCNEYDFFKECDATLKLGIKHRGWTVNTHKHYYGTLDGSSTSRNIPDVNFLHALGYENKEKLHRSTLLGTILDEKKSTYFNETNVLRSHAYHFDAHKVGKYFKKLCENVKHIDAEVNEVILKENGFIKSLKLSTGIEIESDFFIDATGFQRKLMTALNGKWKSYQNHLPVNCALPFLMPYEENEIIEPVTEAWAQKNGWCWNIPTLNRRGMGYVFCDHFISPEKAQEEIELSLNKKIDPIRVLKFDSGRLEKVWIKNCMSVGLCSAFSEPLEATSIHSTIVQLVHFVFEYLKDSLEDTYSEGSANSYNRRVGHMYDTFMDFINLHYMGGRNDSDFWKYIGTGKTQTEFVSNLLEMCKHKCPTCNDFSSFFGHAGWELWSIILAGTERLTPELARKELNFYHEEENGRKIYYENQKHFSLTSENLTNNTEFINLVRQK